MKCLQLDSGAVRAEIVPELGAGLAALDVRGPDGAWWALMRRAPANVTWFNDLACYSLAPWSNRIAAGRFTWGGREVRVAPDWPDGTAIHGLVKDKRWDLVERTPVSALLALGSGDHVGAGWPWRFSCAARYEVLPDGVSIRLSVRNEGDSPMPAGLGFHPFFVRRLWDDRDEVTVRYRAQGRYPAERMIPTGPAASDEITHHLAEGRPIGSLELDDVFAGTTDSARIVWPASGIAARFTSSASLGHAVLYTGLRDSFCFEPVTMVNDGFNLLARGVQGTGVVSLNPGQNLDASWTLTVGTI